MARIANEVREAVYAKIAPKRKTTQVENVVGSKIKKITKK